MGWCSLEMKYTPWKGNKFCYLWSPSGMMLIRDEIYALKRKQVLLLMVANWDDTHQRWNVGPEKETSFVTYGRPVGWYSSEMKCMLWKGNKFCYIWSPSEMILIRDEMYALKRKQVLLLMVAKWDDTHQRWNVGPEKETSFVTYGLQVRWYS